MEVAVLGIAFDEHASKYDSWFMQNPNVLGSEVLLVKSALADAGTILSVGCGSGLFESILARDHGIVIRHGVEPAEGMATIARERGLDVKIAPAEDLPIENASFDTVLMNGTPAYLADLGLALREAHRVLRPGGRVVVADVPASSGYGLLYQLAAKVGTWSDARLQKVAPATPYPVEFLGAAHWRTTEEVLAALRETGFGEFTFEQTLTTHPRFSNDAVESPSAGFERGGYVAIRARKLKEAAR